MTPSQEIAEKIFSTLWKGVDPDIDIFNFVVALIDKAREEAREEERKKPIYGPSVLEAIEKARKEAVEENDKKWDEVTDKIHATTHDAGFKRGMLRAAEIAGNHAEGNQHLCADPAHDDRWCSTCEAMSDEADILEQAIRDEANNE